MVRVYWAKHGSGIWAKHMGQACRPGSTSGPVVSHRLLSVKLSDLFSYRPRAQWLPNGWPVPGVKLPNINIWGQRASAEAIRPQIIDCCSLPLIKCESIFHVLTDIKTICSTWVHLSWLSSDSTFDGSLTASLTAGLFIPLHSFYTHTVIPYLISGSTDFGNMWQYYVWQYEEMCGE